MTVVGPQWQHGGGVLNSRLFFFCFSFSWGFEGRLRRGGGVGRWDTTKEELGVRSCLMGAAKSRYLNREDKSWHVCDNGKYQSTILKSTHQSLGVALCLIGGRWLFCGTSMRHRLCRSAKE